MFKKLKEELPKIEGVEILRPGRQGGLRTRNDPEGGAYGSFGHINWEQFDLNTNQRARMLRTQPMPDG